MKKILATICMSLVLVAGVAVPQRAEAAFGIGDIVLDPVNLIQNTLSYVVGDKVAIKEYILDTLAWEIINLAIDQMTQDIVTWINSGFNGSPAFLQDPGRFLTGVADRAAGGFLDELGAGFLCSPFEADIRLALEIQYYDPGTDLSDRYSCTLSDAIGNVEQFLENDLSQGGLRQFFEITAVPTNNPYLVAIDLKGELEARTSEAVLTEERTLGWNSGFLSKRECKEGQEEPNCTGDILTPGDTIQHQLNESLGVGRDRLLIADEMNEIIGALMGQLVQQALGGAGGLLGVSTSHGGNPSHFDQNISGVDSDSREELEQQIRDGIRHGEQTVRIYNQAFDTANRVANKATALLGLNCSAEDDQRLAEIQAEAGDARSEIRSARNTVEGSVRDLEGLLADLEATNSQSGYLNVGDEYRSMVQAGNVPNQGSKGFAQAQEAQLDVLLLELGEIESRCTVPI